MVKVEKYYIKTRNIKLDSRQAEEHGIRRVYNRTSDMDFVDHDGLPEWVDGLYRKDKGEGVIVESAIKFINGVPLYVSSCIVFNTIEMCNVYYMRNREHYGKSKGFDHLKN